MAVSMIGPKFYAWDKNGKPLAFGKLYTYQARTNTPKPTYQSEDQVVENTNPVILNGEGYANVYLDGAYKMVLKDKDENEIWSSDPVTSAQATEWVNCLVAEYVSPSTFKVAGNFTDIYENGRAVRLSQSQPEYQYSQVESSSFAGGFTTVVCVDPVVLVSIEEVCTSVVGPESIREGEKIGGYSPLIFGTILDLKNRVALNGKPVVVEVGSKVIILERGSELWNITSDQTSDEYLIVDAGDGLQANAIIENKQVSTKLYGITGNSAGEFAAFNSYISYLSDTRFQGVLSGNVFFESKIRVPSNVTLIGRGPNFSGNLIPMGDGYIEFDAEEGDFSQHVTMKDFLIYGDRTTANEIVVYGKNCYSIKGENVRLFDLASGKTGVKFGGGGDCRLKEFVCRPKAGQIPAIGVDVDSGGTVEGIDHTLTLDNPDLEGCTTLLKCSSGHADVKGWYGERASSIGIEVLATGSLTLTGGELIHSGGSAQPLINRGGRLNVIGTKYFDSTDGGRPKAYVLQGDASKSVFVGVPQEQITVESNAVGQPKIFAAKELENSTDTAIRASAVMAKDETVKVIDFSMAAAGTPNVRVTVSAWVNSAGFGKSYHKVEAMVTRAGGSLEITALTPLVAIDETSSGNYTVALELTRNNNISTADISCTLRLTGGLNQSDTPEVEFMVELNGKNNACRMNIINQ